MHGHDRHPGRDQHQAPHHLFLQEQEVDHGRGVHHEDGVDGETLG
jgi:hypothetical protein